MTKKICSILIMVLLISIVSLPVLGEKLEINYSYPGGIFINDAIVPPDIDKVKNAVSTSPNPGFYETSEYMIGSCAVSVIFLESNGGIDTSTENWNTNEINMVKSEIQQGLNWLRFQNINAGISFVYDWQTNVPTQYEPITRPSTFTDDSHEKLWVSDAMAFFGHTSGDWIERTRTHNNVVRTSMGTDWAYTVFIVDSSNDADGFFSDGFPYFAWAYYGVYVVMTYDNGKVNSGGWGISRMDQVLAHETGHIFWATDEYNGIPERSGYLNAYDVENSGCLMFNNNLCLSYGTELQIGWRDSDGDRIQDIVDTNPETILNSYSPNPTSNTVLTYTGSATVSPYQNNNPQPSNSQNSVTINTISNVEYRVDGGAWTTAQASDGSFNNYTESFTFTTSTLNLGTHTIEARALNSVGNYDNSSSSDTVTIIINNAPNKPVLTGPTSGKSGTKYTYEATATDPDGNNIEYFFDWGDGTDSGWIGPYSSGQKGSADNIWNKGTYTIRAKAKDEYGLESDWSTLEITMPKTKISLWERLVERCPFILSIFEY